MNYYQKTLEYESRETLTEVIYDEGVRRIGKLAYHAPTIGKLSDIRFPYSMESIGYFAFSNQNNLHAILFRGDLAILDEKSCYGCSENLTIYGVDQGVINQYANLHNYSFIPLNKPIIKEREPMTAPGMCLEFNAKVYVDIDTYFSDVNWEFQKNASDHTFIDDGGILHVGIDELADVLIIRANWDGKTDSVTVPIVKLSELSKIILPNALVCVEEEAFTGISAEVVCVPQNCKKIASRAFTDCQHIKYVVVYDKDLIDIVDDAFENEDIYFFEKDVD